MSGTLPTGNPAKHGGTLRRGGGRPKGVPNRTTVVLKDALLLAAEKAGGKAGLVGYLTTQAVENPSAFLPLLGKVLPLQIQGDKENPLIPPGTTAIDALLVAIGGMAERIEPPAPLVIEGGEG